MQREHSGGVGRRLDRQPSGSGRRVGDATRASYALAVVRDGHAARLGASRQIQFSLKPIY